RDAVPLGDRSAFSGVIAEEPHATERSQRLTVKLLPPRRGKIEIVTNRFPEFEYGEVLRAEGLIEKRKGIAELPTSVFPEIAATGENRGFPPKRFLVNLKHRLVHQFKRTLPAESAALMAGLTFGVRSDFSEGFRDAMARSGTTHLVALSGYNIAILVFAVANSLGRFLSRKTTFYAALAIIFLFVLMVGAQASVVRAAIMGALILVAREAGRAYNLRNAITLTAVAMVFFDPAMLAHDVGFQLSFLSLLGIVYLQPALAHLAFRGKEPRPSFLAWKENALTTVAAQLAVIPLIVKYFDEFSLTSFLANVLILEFVPLTMLLGFLLAGIAAAAPAVGIFLGILANVLLSYHIAVIKLFARVSIPLPLAANTILAAGLYIGILLMIFTLHKRVNATSR
ncbi:ComEC/Rec2 family competence protein, partial [Candidatus Parcubacteria bacterium]